jgi:hypothetical protein
MSADKNVDLPVSSIAFSKPTFSKLLPFSTSLFLFADTVTAKISSNMFMTSSESMIIFQDVLNIRKEANIFY